LNAGVGRGGCIDYHHPLTYLREFTATLRGRPRLRITTRTRRAADCRKEESSRAMHEARAAQVRSRNRRRRPACPPSATAAAAILALLVGACTDAAGPGPAPPVSLQIPVLGHGAVDERYTAEVAVAEPWAYTSTWGDRGVPGNALKIWNVAGASPVLVDSIIIASATTLGDVQISDDGALLVVPTEPSPHGSLVIFDRSDPASPREIARYQSETTRPGVHTAKLGRVAGTLYAFLSVNPVNAPPRLVVLELAHPASPREVAAVVMGSPVVHDVFVRDGWLFTALWNDGLGIWDIGAESGSPASPRLVGQLQTIGGRAHNVWWFHSPGGESRRYVFVGEEGGPLVPGVSSVGDIHVVDITDMTQPREVAYFTLPGAGTHNFVMDEARGILYAAYYNGGVRALDVRGDLGACPPAQRGTHGRCSLALMGREIGHALASTVAAPRAVWGVALAGRNLYASDMLTGLYKLDVRPLAP
jgi:hypothetical protein